MKLKPILPLLAAMMCSACAPQLVILHTNDTHSHLDPMRSGEGGVIERAAFADSVRNRHGADRVILLHAGDWNQGTSYHSELGGAIEVELVNELRYDAVTLGNHEFDEGIESLTERLSKIKVPVVCANLDLRSFELYDYVKPYTIVRKGGMKIGIVGLEADITSCVSKAVSSRIPQLDPVEAANRWAAHLKENEKCDMVILLSHQGYEEDQANAAKIRNVDLVIGGHTHTFVDGFVYVRDLDGREVPIVTDGRWGLEMGEIKINCK